MNARTAFVAASMAGLALLAGCSTSISGTAQAATTVAQSETSAASSDLEGSNVSAPTVETSTIDESPNSSQGAPTQSEESTSEANSETSTPAGSDLDANSVAWLGAFCTGFIGVTKFAAPDTAGLSDAAAVQTIAQAYTGMSSAATATANELDTLPAPTFPGASTLAPAIHNWLMSVASVYSDGAHRIESGTYATAQELKDEIDSIESSMGAPNKEIGAAFSQADPSVQSTLQSLPECQALASGG